MGMRSPPRTERKYKELVLRHPSCIRAAPPPKVDFWGGVCEVR